MPRVREVVYTVDGRRDLDALPAAVQDALRDALGNRAGESHPVGRHEERLVVEGRAYTVETW